MTSQPLFWFQLIEVNTGHTAWFQSAGSNLWDDWFQPSLVYIREDPQSLYDVTHYFINET